MVWRSHKPLLERVPKARKGKPPIGLQRYVDLLNKVSSDAFNDELRKLARPLIEKRIDQSRATEAIRTVREVSPIRHAEVASISGSLGPGVLVASRAAKALVDAKSGNRARAVKDAVKGLTRGDFAQSVVGAGLTGAGISYGRTTMGRARAKRIIGSMGLGKYVEKRSARFGSVVMPPKPPTVPSVTKLPKVVPKIRPPINPYKTVHQAMKPQS